MTENYLHPNTYIRMFNLTIKNAKNIKIGDYLMGDDNTPRTVSSIINGKEEMFKIFQEYGSSYIVNKNHILTLKRKSDNIIIDIPIMLVIGNEHLYLPINGYFCGNIDNKDDAILYANLYSDNCIKDIKYPKDFPLLPNNYLEWNSETKLCFYLELIKNKNKNRVYIQESYPIQQIINLLKSSGIRCKRYNRFIIFKENFETFRISFIGNDEYCGFTIDGNKKILLGDWAISNTI
jgi:hypothetical protein